MALTPQFVNPHGQGSRTTWKQPMIASGDQYGTLDAAVAITVTGQTGRRVVVTQVAWSYNSAPTGGAVTIQDSDGSPVTYFSLDISAAGPGSFTFEPPIALPSGLNAVITLADPGGAIVGKLFVNAHVQS